MRKGLRPTRTAREGYSRPLVSGLIDSYLEDGGDLKTAAQAHNISYSTLINWINENKDGFNDKYLEARALKVLMYAEELISLADKAAECEDNTQLSALKLRIDTRKWMIERLMPDFAPAARRAADGQGATQNQLVQIILPDNQRGDDPNRIVSQQSLQIAALPEAPVDANWWEREDDAPEDSGED